MIFRAVKAAEGLQSVVTIVLPAWFWLLIP